MSEEKKEEKKEEKVKEIKVGDSVSFTETFTVIKISSEAAKELGALPQNVRQEVLGEAVEVSKGTVHPYDVTLEDVLDAKKKKGV